MKLQALHEVTLGPGCFIVYSPKYKDCPTDLLSLRSSKKQVIEWPNGDDKRLSPHCIRSKKDFEEVAQLVAATHGLDASVEEEWYPNPYPNHYVCQLLGQKGINMRLKPVRKVTLGPGCVIDYSISSAEIRFVSLRGPERKKVEWPDSYESLDRIQIQGPTCIRSKKDFEEVAQLVAATHGLDAFLVKRECTSSYYICWFIF